MKHLLPLAVASAVALGGCATAPVVQVDYDRTADFTSYKTFGFASPLGTDRNGYQTILSQYLKVAAQRELEARGMRLDTGAPQLLVNFSANLTDKLRVISTPDMTMGVGLGRGYYGYRAGMYSAWPMYDPTLRHAVQGRHAQHRCRRCRPPATRVGRRGHGQRDAEDTRQRAGGGRHGRGSGLLQVPGSGPGPGQVIPVSDG